MSWRSRGLSPRGPLARGLARARWASSPCSRSAVWRRLAEPARCEVRLPRAGAAAGTQGAPGRRCDGRADGDQASKATQRASFSRLMDVTSGTRRAAALMSSSSSIGRRCCLPIDAALELR